MKKVYLIDSEMSKIEIDKLPLTYHFIELIDLSKVYFNSDSLKVSIKKIQFKNAVKRTFPKNITLL